MQAMHPAAAPGVPRRGTRRPSHAGRRGVMFLLLLLCGWRAATPAAGAELTLDAVRQWSYAESLLSAGETYRAVSEYQRLLHFFPAAPQAAAAQLRIAQAYLRAGRPALALEHLAQPDVQRLGPPHLGDVQFLRALARLELERDAPYPLRVPRIESALADLRAIPPDWPRHGEVAGFVGALEAPPAFADKSPWLAGGLSAVLPGTGSVYVGRYAEGALAFFLTGVLTVSAAASFDAEQPALGVVFGGLALAFYGGGIYSAVGGAHKHNDTLRSAYLAQQRRRYGLVVGPVGMAAAFEASF